MHPRRLSQRSATKRTQLAAGLVAALLVSACGMTTQNPDDAPSTAGTAPLATSGTSSSSGGTRNRPPDISPPSGGRAGSSSAAGGADVAAPSGAGAPSEIVGGASSEVVGGAPNAAGAPNSGGAPGSNCATFEEAWQTYECTAVTETELACREVCSTARESCEGRCEEDLDACSTDCIPIDNCNICAASAKLCKLQCARRSAICQASCLRAGTTCRNLRAAYPDCPVPELSSSSSG